MCIDHLHLDDMRVCHLMDATTRYSLGSVVPDDGMEQSVLVLEANWISPFWEPASIQFDQAFNNQKFKEYLDLYSILGRRIPARRHNKNVLESKHRIIGDVFLRMKSHNENGFGPILVDQAINVPNDLYGIDVRASRCNRPVRWYDF